MRRKRIVSALLSIGMAAMISGPMIAAQEQGFEPVYPELCVTEPISEERLTILIGDAKVELATATVPGGAGEILFGTPVPIVPETVGEPDPLVRAAVIAVIQEWVACRNAGEVMRSYELFTEDFARLYLNFLYGRLDVETTFDAASFQPDVPIMPEAMQAGVAEIVSVDLLGDGRVVAELFLFDPVSAGSMAPRPGDGSVPTATDPTTLTPDDMRVGILIVFEEGDDAWLIDGLQVEGAPYIGSPLDEAP